MYAMILRSLGGHRVFIRLLLPYIAFLVLAMLVGWIIYQQTLQVMEKEITSNNTALLEQSKNVLDRRFEEIGKMTFQLINHPRIMQFAHVTDPFEGSNTYRILETRKELAQYSPANPFEYFVFFKNSELVLTSSSIYSFEDFYKMQMQYPGMSYEQWKPFYFDAFHNRKYYPARDVILNGKRASMVTYIQTLGYPGYHQGAVVVLIDNREIQKLLSGVDLSGGGWTSIMDEQGRAISSLTSGSEVFPIDQAGLTGAGGVIRQTIGSKDMMITYTKSAQNGWTYLVVQPADTVLEKVRYMQKITFSFAFAFLLAGVITAYILAYRNSKPLLEIVNSLLQRGQERHVPSKDTYAFIKEAISGLADNRDRLLDEMKRQAPLLQAALFERLLRGEFLSRKDTETLLSFTDMAPGHPYFVVVLAHWSVGGTNTELQRVVVKDLLRQSFQSYGCMHDAADDQIVIVCTFEQRNAVREALQLTLMQAAERISESIGTYLSFAIGGMYEGLAHVSRSYEEARQVLQHQLWEGVSGISWYADMGPAKESNEYYYPAEMETRLMNVAKAGEWEQASGLLKELREENLGVRNLSYAMRILFVCEMWGTLVKLLPQVGQQQGVIYRNLMSLAGTTVSMQDVERYYTEIEDTYRTICRHVNEHRKSKQARYVEEIVELVKNHYMLPELGLDWVADRLKVSKVYISQIFKEHTGENFFDYLETLRMNEAKGLLLETDIAVQEIAGKVGYNSSNTFCRAFKRITGVSTTAFRSTKRI